MESEKLVSNKDIQTELDSLGFNRRCVGDGRLMLAELLLKAGEKRTNLPADK